MWPCSPPAAANRSPPRLRHRRCGRRPRSTARTDDDAVAASTGTVTTAPTAARSDHRPHGIHLAQRQRRLLHRPDRRPLRHLRARLVSPAPAGRLRVRLRAGHLAVTRGERRHSSALATPHWAAVSRWPTASRSRPGCWCATARSRASRAATPRPDMASRSLARPIGCSDPRRPRPHGVGFVSPRLGRLLSPSRRATISPVACGCSAVGSASPCQGEGRGFESRHPLEGARGINPSGGVAEW